MYGGRQRRNQVVTAYDRWQADAQAAEDAAGFTEADREYNAASNEHAALRNRIVLLRSTDPAALRLKLRLLLWSCRSVDDIDRSIDRELEDCGAYADAALFIIARDAVAAQAGQVQA